MDHNGIPLYQNSLTVNKMVQHIDEWRQKERERERTGGRVR